MGAFSILHISLFSYISYLLGMVTYNIFIQTWLERLIHHNILCVKIFQALSGNRYFSKVVTDVFLKQTNDTAYSQRDIDRELVDRIVEEHDLVLDDPDPKNSGMVALVFFARGRCVCCSEDSGTTGYSCSNDLCAAKRRVVLKTKRRNIYNRIKSGHDEFVTIYNMLARIGYFIPMLTEILNSLRSIADTRDYILSQCDFNEEILCMKTMREEMLGVIDEVMIPQVFNSSPDDNEYILMEHFDGCRIDELKTDEDRISAFIGISKTAGFGSFVGTYFHTDIHPGNVICVRANDGTIKSGLIDFGMNARVDDDLREISLGLYTSIAEKVRNPDSTPPIIRRCAKCFDPPLSDETFDSLSKEQFESCNILFMDMMTTMYAGKFDETQVHKCMVHFNKILSGTVQYRISDHAFKLLMALSMIQSSGTICVPDLKVRDTVQKKVMKWAMLL